MRTVVTFQSDAFNTTEERPYFINPCCFGDDVARWLVARLRSAGLSAGPEVGQEDFGWYFDFAVAEGDQRADFDAGREELGAPNP